MQPNDWPRFIIGILITVGGIPSLYLEILSRRHEKKESSDNILATIDAMSMNLFLIGMGILLIAWSY
jgi:hypothetical protein